jgi:predicted nucleic acid-binding protein
MERFTQEAANEGRLLHSLPVTDVAVGAIGRYHDRTVLTRDVEDYAASEGSRRTTG